MHALNPRRALRASARPRRLSPGHVLPPKAEVSVPVNSCLGLFPPNLKKLELPSRRPTNPLWSCSRLNVADSSWPVRGLRPQLGPARRPSRGAGPSVFLARGCPVRRGVPCELATRCASRPGEPVSPRPALSRYRDSPAATSASPAAALLPKPRPPREEAGLSLPAPLPLCVSRPRLTGVDTSASSTSTERSPAGALMGSTNWLRFFPTF